MQQVQNVMAAVEKFDMKIAPQAIAIGPSTGRVVCVRIFPGVLAPASHGERRKQRNPMDEALALGQLLREDCYQRDAQEVGRLERHADHRNPNPARRAVQVDPDKKGQQHEQQRGDEHQSQ